MVNYHHLKHYSFFSTYTYLDNQFPVVTMSGCPLSRNMTTDLVHFRTDVADYKLPKARSLELVYPTSKVSLKRFLFYEVLTSDAENVGVPAPVPVGVAGAELPLT